MGSGCGIATNHGQQRHRRQPRPRRHGSAPQTISPHPERRLSFGTGCRSDETPPRPGCGEQDFCMPSRGNRDPTNSRISTMGSALIRLIASSQASVLNNIYIEPGGGAPPCSRSTAWPAPRRGASRDGPRRHRNGDPTIQQLEDLGQRVEPRHSQQARPPV